MKTAICTISFSCLFFFTGCTNKKLDYSEKTNQDSLHLFLDLAAQDSLPSPIRFNYNEKAFKIIKNQENDSMHRVYLFRVANRYFNLKDRERYGDVSKIIIKESESENDTLALAKAYDYLGDYYKSPEKIDSAFICFWKAERLYRILNDQPKIGYIYGKIAGMYAFVGDNTNTELYSIKVLKALKDSNDKNSIFESYNELGNVFANRQEYEKALEYYDRALKIASSNEIPSVFHPKVTIFNNIGVVYQSLGDYEKAKGYFKKGLDEKDLFIDKTHAYAALLSNLAFSEFKLKDYSNLPELYYKALHIRDSVKDYEGVMHTKLNLSAYFAAMSDSVKAQNYAQEALLIAEKMKKDKNVLVCLMQLAYVEPQKASFYKQEYIKLNDSLHDTERKLQNKFARIRYETDEIIVEKDEAINQKWTVFWIAVSVLLLVLAYYVLHLRQSRHRELLLLLSKQKADEEIYRLISERHRKFEEGREKEKQRIAKELHDGVMSRLSGIRTSLLVLEQKADSETVKHSISQIAEIQDVEKEIRDIAYGLGRDSFSIKRDYPELLASVIEESASKTSLKINLEIDKSIDWDTFDSRKKLGIYQILQECLHFRGKSEADVTIRFYKDNSLLIMKINDVGFKAESHEKEQVLKAIGLKAEEMGADLRISNILEEKISLRMTILMKADQNF